VLKALAALRGLGAPAKKIKFEVAKQRWNWAAPLISEVYHNAATTRQQVIVAGRVSAGWERYWGWYLPQKAGRTKWLDRWDRTCDRLERLWEMEECK
jgi:hypothetical protein